MRPGPRLPPRRPPRIQRDRHLLNPLDQRHQRQPRGTAQDLRAHLLGVRRAEVAGPLADRASLPLIQRTLIHHRQHPRQPPLQILSQLQPPPRHRPRPTQTRSHLIAGERIQLVVQGLGRGGSTRRVHRPQQHRRRPVTPPETDLHRLNRPQAHRCARARTHRHQPQRRHTTDTGPPPPLDAHNQDARPTPRHLVLDRPRRRASRPH